MTITERATASSITDDALTDLYDRIETAEADVKALTRAMWNLLDAVGVARNA